MAMKNINLHPQFIMLPFAAAVVFALSGCTTGSAFGGGHAPALDDAIAQLGHGDVAGAASTLEATESAKKKDILYYMEKGTIQRLGSDYAGSRDSWLQAEETVRGWEKDFRTDPDKTIGDIGSVLVNDRVRKYTGRDYEKVFLSTELVLNHVMLGKDDLARIEMKRTFEREALIEAFRKKEYEKVEDSTKKEGISGVDATTLAEKGYPVQDLDVPEVRSLKNGYQNAFAHYLAGYYFESVGEYSLAEPGYNIASKLAPDSKLARQKADRVGQNKPGAKEADVLFVVESGVAPAWRSIEIAVDVRVKDEQVIVPLSFPVINPSNKIYVPDAIYVGRSVLPLETLVNVDAMARHELRDQLPGIIGRTVVRGVLKSALQHAANENAKKHGGYAGALLSIGTKAVTVGSEHADDRTWRTLPSRLSIARANLPLGENTIEFRTSDGTVFRGTVNIDKKMTIIPIRLIRGYAYIGQLDAKGEIVATGTHGRR